MKRKGVFVFIGMVSLAVISCATVGQYLPSTPEDAVIGTIQTSFIIRSGWSPENKVINTLAYIKLLEAAVQKYAGAIDVRDIVWVTGRAVDSLNVEVAATAAVIRLDYSEK